MMTITASTAKRLSKIGQRAAFGLAVLELAKEDQGLIALTSDVSTSGGLERLRNTLPDQFIDVGIAEQNMMGIATGLASQGYRVVTTTFAPFQTMRCCEQIRVNLGYMEEKVCFVGLASGISLSALGNTHCCIEDVGIMRCMPNIAIVSPADCGSVGKLLEAALHWDTSVYVRLTGEAPNPIVYNEDTGFEIGKAKKLRDGKTVAIIAAGTMVWQALRAAETLEGMGIGCAVADMHTIKPLDQEMIDSVLESQLIITVEEHNVIGGLGSAVAEYLAPKRVKPPHIALGINDTYPAGVYQELLGQHGLTAEKIVEKIEGYLR